MNFMVNYETEQKFSKQKSQPELKTRKVSSVYLTSYNQVNLWLNLKKVSKKSFLEKVSSLLNEPLAKVWNVIQWVRSMKKH